MLANGDEPAGVAVNVPHPKLHAKASVAVKVKINLEK